MTDLVHILHIKNLIEERHYLTAMKFRWLYSKVFGNSQIKAYDMSKIKGRELNIREKWYEEIAEEYQYIRKILVKEKYYQKLFDLCILNMTPKNININQYITIIKEGLILFEKIILEILMNKRKKIM